MSSRSSTLVAVYRQCIISSTCSHGGSGGVVGGIGVSYGHERGLSTRRFSSDEESTNRTPIVLSAGACTRGVKIPHAFQAARSGASDSHAATTAYWTSLCAWLFTDMMWNPAAA